MAWNRKLKGRTTAAAVALAVLTCGGYLSWQAGAPYRAAKGASQAIAQRDWDALLTYASDRERRWNNWNNENFRALCTRMTAHLDLDLGQEIAEASPSVDKQSVDARQGQKWDTRSERKYRWLLPQSVTIAGRNPAASIAALRDVKGRWTICVGSILLVLNRCNRKRPNDSVENLALALDEAQLTTFYSMLSDSVITRTRLDALLRGEIKQEDLWLPLEGR